CAPALPRPWLARAFFRASGPCPARARVRRKHRAAPRATRRSPWYGRHTHTSTACGCSCRPSRTNDAMTDTDSCSTLLVQVVRAQVAQQILADDGPTPTAEKWRQRILPVANEMEQQLFQLSLWPQQIFGHAIRCRTRHDDL